MEKIIKEIEISCMDSKELEKESFYWTNEIIEMTKEERIQFWCYYHEKSKAWGEKLDNEKLDKLGCPKEKIILEFYK